MTPCNSNATLRNEGRLKMRLCGVAQFLSIQSVIIHRQKWRICGVRAATQSDAYLPDEQLSDSSGYGVVDTSRKMVCRLENQ